MTFNVQPLRLEGFETHRAGLLIVLTVLYLPLIWHGFKAAPRILKIALAVWIAALLCSTMFSLSPERSLLGDLLRRRGLISVLASLAFLFVGMQLSLASTWRWVFGFGVVQAVYILLQHVDVLPTIFIDRVPGTLGAPTFAGTWLTLVILWSCVGITSPLVASINIRQRGSAPLHMGRGGRTFVCRTVRSEGVRFVGIFLMLLALYATGSRGAMVALAAGGLTWVALWLLRYPRLLMMCFIVLLVGVSALLINQPRLLRSDPNAPDSSRISREIVWSNVLEMTQNPPRLVRIDGKNDANFALRPFFGYGLAMFETVHHPYVDAELRAHESGRPIDRAHNIWLDTWVTAGLLGLLSYGAVFVCLAYLALKDVGLRHLRDLSLESRFLLTILVAYLVDMQFSFETNANSWLFWCAMGMGISNNRIQQRVRPSAHWLVAFITFAGIVKLILVAAGHVSGDSALLVAAVETAVLLICCVFAALSVCSQNWRFLVSPFCKKVTNIILVFTVFILAFGFGIDVWIDTSIANGDTPALLRPWDDRLRFRLAGVAIETEPPESALRHAEAAIRINPYDSGYAYLRAVIEMQSALTEVDYATHLDSAAHYFEVATQMTPNEPYLWREWARFEFIFMQNPTAALANIQQALMLAPDDADSRDLLTQIEGWR